MIREECNVNGVTPQHSALQASSQNRHLSVLDDFQDLNFRLHIQTQVKFWPLIKNDPCVVFISLTKIWQRVVKNQA